MVLDFSCFSILKLSFLVLLSLSLSSLAWFDKQIRMHAWCQVSKKKINKKRERENKTSRMGACMCGRVCVCLFEVEIEEVN